MQQIKDFRIERELPPEPKKGEYKEKAEIIVTTKGDRLQVIVKQVKN